MRSRKKENTKKTPDPKNGNTVSFQKAKSKNGCISRRWKRGTELWIPDTSLHAACADI